MYFDKEIDRKLSLVPGLLWRPSLRPPHRNNQETIEPYHSQWAKKVTRDFSEYDGAVLRRELNHHVKCIVEIGVAADKQDPSSSTAILLKDKPATTTYIGIDVADRSQWNDPAKRIYTIKRDSKRRDLVFSLMKQLKLATIDVLVIDGNHSVDQVINDWSYTDRLATKGTAILHAISIHPGPSLLIQALSEKYWHKELYQRQDDWGMAVVRRRPD